MTTLPRLLPLAGALVLGALAVPVTAAEPWPAMTQPIGLAAPQPGLAAPTVTAFTDGTHPWAPPPLPPLPGAFLWEDYAQVGPAQRYDRTRRGACSPGHVCSRGSPHVLTLVSDVLDGFCSLITFPARKASANRQCAGGQCGAGSYELNPALRDWGAYPPADALPSYLPPQPPPEQAMPVHPPTRPAPIQPRTDSPPGVPPTITIDEGLPPLRNDAGGPGQSAEPQRLYPGRAPVVELAPNVPIPPEPSTLPPQNAIPKAGDRPPKNVIPRRNGP